VHKILTYIEVKIIWIIDLRKLKNLIIFVSV